MKTRSALAAALTVIFSAGFAFANTKVISSPAAAKAKAAAKTDAAAVTGPDSVQAAEIKTILLKLVNQDEYLDETIETLESSGRKLSAHDISAMGLSLKIVKNELDAISAMNKKEFTEVRPESGVTKYTKTMLSYSRAVSQKISRIGVLVAETSLKNKKLAMRDAISSKKGGKAGGGKKLTQIIEEQKAVEKLSSDIRLLKDSSRKLNATSRWLYIVTK